MIYRFRFNVIMRIVLLALFLYLIPIAWQQSNYALFGFVSITIGFMLWNMFHYIDQTNRDVAGFLNAVKFNDFTTVSSGGHRGKSFGDLHNSFNVIHSKFKNIRADKEANHQFLQTVVEQIEIGLLCYNEKGEVKFMNKALQQMLRKPFLLHIDKLNQIDPGLTKALIESQAGEPVLFKLNIANRLLQLALRTTSLRLPNEQLYLVSIKNIQNELEEQELVAWQKLIRILTHEIMNSVAPISSLADTVDNILSEEQPLDEATIADIRLSIQAIRKRGDGLLTFTDTYRKLTRIPPPHIQSIQIEPLLKDVLKLFENQAQQQNVQVKIHQHPSIKALLADPVLLEQILINLIKNSMEALTLEEDGKIDVYIKRNQNKSVTISIVDNGPGIPQDKMDNVFVPFFTTKLQGSGIGLSLSRQIMRLHNGRIELQSKVEEGTVVSLIF